ALGRSLRDNGWQIHSVVTQSRPTAQRAVRFIGQGRGFAGISREALGAREILIATPDSAIAGVAKELARFCAEEWRGKAVLHTSGALPSSVLNPIRAFGAAVGSLHPLQSFSGIGMTPLAGRVFVIEGDPAALQFARRIVRALEGYTLQLPVSGKAAYHAAASMSAGHILAVLEAATTILMSLGIKRRDAVRALLPLTRQVLDNFEKLGPRAAWTGPLARGDFEVIAAHLAALRDYPAEVRRAYEQLNRLSARVLSQHPEKTLSKLEEMQIE